MKTIIEFVVKTIDTCKSSYDNISKDELKNKIEDKFKEECKITTLEYKESVIKEFVETYMERGVRSVDRVSEYQLKYYYNNYCNLNKLFTSITELKNYLVKYLNAEVDRYEDIVGYTLIHHSDVLF